MELYLCRHGETEWSLTGQHTSYSDIPLTENGEKQALLLGKRLKLLHFDLVYSSPRQRARQTCKLAGFDPIIDADLAEWDYGKYEGLKWAEIEKSDPNWCLFDHGAPGGETPEQVGTRADRFIKKLSEKSGKAAVFSHGHFSRVLAARWLHLNPGAARNFLLSVASLSDLSHDRNQPVIALWNDTEHLK